MSYLEIEVLSIHDGECLIQLLNGTKLFVDSGLVLDEISSNYKNDDRLEALAVHLEEMALRMRHISHSSEHDVTSRQSAVDAPVRRPEPRPSKDTPQPVEPRSIDADGASVDVSAPSQAATQPAEAPDPQNYEVDTVKNEAERILGVSTEDKIDLPFRLNDPSAGSGDLSKSDAATLNALWDTNPEYKFNIVKRIAGCTRSNMLALKELLNDELRRMVVIHLTSNDVAAQRTNVVPATLVAFEDPRPLSETLFTPQWDPGFNRSRKAAKKKPPNWEQNAATLDEAIDEDAIKVLRGQQAYQQLKSLSESTFGSGVESIEKERMG